MSNIKKYRSVKYLVVLFLTLIFEIVSCNNIFDKKGNLFLYNQGLLAVYNGDSNCYSDGATLVECDYCDSYTDANGYEDCTGQTSSNCDSCCNADDMSIPGYEYVIYQCTFNNITGACGSSACVSGIRPITNNNSTSPPPVPPSPEPVPPETPPTDGCSPLDGDDGVCGSANNGVFPSYPATGLCNNGTFSWQDYLAIDGTFNWTCIGDHGYCGGTPGSTANCSAASSLPYLTSLIVNNNVGNLVTPDSGNRYQICDLQFNNSTVTQIIITANDRLGVDNISLIGLKIGTNIYQSQPIAGTSIFDNINFAGISPGSYNFEVNIENTSGVSTGWINSGSMIKNWDCQVGFAGSFYDNSNATSCNFTNKLPLGLPSFDLTLTAHEDGSSVSTTINPPEYSGEPNKLIWGKTYITTLNSAPGTLSGAQVNNICTDVNNIDTKKADAYADNPTLDLDYSLTVSQSWFQAQGGGVIGNQNVSNSIPATCALNLSLCTPAVSISSLNSKGGIVASATDSNNCGLEGTNCTFGEVDRNWKVKASLAKSNYTYSYFYNQYFQNLGQGVTTPATLMSDLFLNLPIGGTGVVFVNGNLTIDTNNTLSSGKYLLLVVNGDINIDPSVTNVSGILLADKNINIGGTATSQLIINGSLYTPKGSINLTRSFDDLTLNQTTPSVLVNYRPDFIFSLPGKLVKLISGWKQGY